MKSKSISLNEDEAFSLYDLLNRTVILYKDMCHLERNKMSKQRRIETSKQIMNYSNLKKKFNKLIDPF
jgi:hypothetical protein